MDNLRLLPMGVENFSDESTDNDSSRPRTTYYQFENPDHPDSKENFKDPEKARNQYNAARSIQDEMGTDRHNLVGEFLVAVNAMQEEGDTEQLDAFVEALKA